jgi:H/ACA ribonucleoprotein complex subunit 4
MKPINKLIKFGIINIDKPSGPTSFSVSSLVRRKLNLNKTSHLGTLDPKVTGVLPVALGRACKLAGFFMGHDKGYVGVLHCHKFQKIEELQKLIDDNFIGKIKQTPPHKSAVKRAERVREVYSWELLEEDNDGKDFLFYCDVQGGTYIRKLCSDLGEMVGGAHMAELRRSKAGIFNEEKMYDFNEFDEAVKKYNDGDSEMLASMIVPAEEAVKRVMTCIQVEKRVLKVIMTGKPLFLNDIIDVEKFRALEMEERFAVFCGEQFVEIARKVSDYEMVAKPEFVCN